MYADYRSERGGQKAALRELLAEAGSEMCVTTSPNASLGGAVPNTSPLVSVSCKHLSRV